MHCISQRNGRNELLKQTCPTNLLSAVHHILRTSAAWMSLQKWIPGIWSGCLEFQKGNVLNLHKEQISFRQCITFCQHGSWKAGSPASNPLLLNVAKSSILAMVLPKSLYWTSQILDQTTPWPNPLLLCIRQVFFCSCNEGMGMMQT